VHAYQCYATADVGLIAYETAAREGLVLDEGVIVEIVRPGTGDPVPDGEVGEVVVTVLNPDYPLVRFGTGDLSAVLPGPCPTGRTNARIKGWLGRADQTAKVRGMFVHPSQVAEVLRATPNLGRARLVVEGEMANDRMTLKAEARAPAPEGLAERRGRSQRARRDQAARRGRAVRAGQPAQRRQGDRGRAPEQPRRHADPRGAGVVHRVGQGLLHDASQFTRPPCPPAPAHMARRPPASPA
jgi:phenylacetate-coenzyme A ligase PaaK-like adenylate-forming protein